MQSRALLLSFLLLSFLFITVQMQAFEGGSSKTWGVGFHIGPVFGSSVNVDPPDEEFDTDGGFMYGFDFDGYVSDRMSMGLRVLGTSVDLSDVSDVSLEIMNISGTLKGHIPLGPKSKFCPGFAIGYNSIGVDGTDLDDSAGLNLSLMAGFAYSVNARSAVTVEFSFLSQVTGGGDDYDLTFAPIPFLQIGYEFGN